MNNQQIYDLPEWKGIEDSLKALRGNRNPSDRFIAEEDRLKQKIKRLIRKTNGY